MSIAGSVTVLLVLAALFVGLLIITPLIWRSKPRPRVPEDSAGPSARQPSQRRDT